MPTPARLIVLTRYPEPGRTKTRLIPALGPEGVAQLQRQMTEHTLRQIRPLVRHSSLSVEIRFTGGSRLLMEAWLGPQWSYAPQGEGDLGCRLKAAFQAAFEAGMERVVAIGIDCPQVDTAILGQALQALTEQDVVLGPAADGGYYLVGLRQWVPELFEDIAWSTDLVLQQTVAIARQQNLSVALLPTLTDIDRPDDLSIWYEVAERNAASRKISVVVPVINEEHTIVEVVQGAAREPNVDVIVVDGGSGDRTVELARSAGATVISAPPGRASQMNAGARIARGDVLLFLHADTRLPQGFSETLLQLLEKPGVVAGAFQLGIDGTVPGLKLVEWGVKWRSLLCQSPYGDQAIFLNAATFRAVGGFPDLPIMEDFELVRRLRRMGRIAIAPTTVLTSGRRWDKLGILQTTLMNQVLIGAYLLGFPLDRLAKWYRCDRR